MRGLLSQGADLTGIIWQCWYCRHQTVTPFGAARRVCPWCTLHLLDPIGYTIDCDDYWIRVMDSIRRW